ncbi:hypothetical protein CJD36_021260 [Flavipsychrobacter stenotrophus]|uniref:Methionyl-tRNA formyltransferase n=1 Tax=Flavipsychrobacter stenotrophus TaxID=2077091 RepID=A0A2S7SQC4_9BACT|nr:formyltransferase family protein [Flavipsychrobacter stenotrophus]PQJ09103.1 hypothetical protein CJD36_021260 [Flavipsychrobacter stenotrophus]
MKIALLCNNKMAFPALQTIAASGHLCGVVTTGRDKEIVAFVGQFCEANDVPCNIISDEDRWIQLSCWLRAIQPDVVFVMTFPWKVPAHLLQVPQLGFINFHYGLLPEMRGADPIFESIRQRRATAGLTVHKMDEGFDTGDILMREEFPLSPEFTYGMLCGQMARIGETACKTLIGKLETGVIPDGYKQDEARACYLPKLKKEEIVIRWAEMTLSEIIALIRSCNPIAMGIPTALNGWAFGICDASPVQLNGDVTGIIPGTIVALDVQNGMLVYCKDGLGLKVEVINTAEGFFPGYKLAMWGVVPGMTLN